MNLLNFILLRWRILKYKLLSDCQKINGKPMVFHPVLLRGKGTISFGDKVQIGVLASPCFYSHYAYIEARTPQSKITIGNQVTLNNGFSAEAMGEITIKDKVLIGVHCAILDNDGHALDPNQRESGLPSVKPVMICENVFIGDRVTILKGVTIGANSVIGSGAVVTHDIPENVIAAGNPARVIRNI